MKTDLNLWKCPNFIVYNSEVSSKLQARKSPFLLYLKVGIKTLGRRQKYHCNFYIISISQCIGRNVPAEWELFIKKRMLQAEMYQ